MIKWRDLIFKEAKTILGTQALGDTRAETKRRQAAVKAKEALQEVTKSTGGRKPTLKRLGTMANTAKVNPSFLLITSSHHLFSMKEKHT